VSLLLNVHFTTHSRLVPCPLWCPLSKQGAENTVGMMEAGMIPNVVDYYDVDTDPTGRFVAWRFTRPPSGSGGWILVYHFIDMEYEWILGDDMGI